jgi:seryl-tRNA synthetase
MLDPKAVLSDPERAATQWSARGLDGESTVEELAAIDRARKESIQAHDSAKHRQTELSAVFRDPSAAPETKAEARDQLKPISDEIKTHATATKAAEDELRNQLMGLCNWSHESVPRGKSETENVVVRTWGEIPSLDFEPAPHWEVGEALGILDFEAAASISGSGFAVYRGAGARLERALMSMMLDVHTEKHGYTEILAPYLVTRETMEGTGQLPKFEDDAFKTTDDMFLIPTSEVSVTNMHRGDMLDANELPILYASYSSCFRREAGSYGRDVKGLSRLHQFQKVEMVKLSAADTSYDELEAMVQNAETILQMLELPYRVLLLCTGDTGFASAKTFDLEVWLPGHKEYREISSVSNCESFQARRGSIRYRPAPGEKPLFVHTLNGSGVAIGRTIVALLENGQQPDGSVILPKALRPYMGGLDRLISGNP